jgi:hypothetical protein
MIDPSPQTGVSEPGNNWKNVNSDPPEWLAEVCSTFACEVKATLTSHIDN